MEPELLDIRYEDEDIIVCIKPAGTASETKRAGQQDMASLLRNYRHRRGEEPYIGLIHRLDQPVEGILVFGKNPHSSAALSRQLAQGAFCKDYLAVTQGDMPAREGKLLDYLKKDGRSNTSHIAHAGDAQAKKAELWYQVLETDTGGHLVHNLVKIRLLTGRHHQIRVQMAHLGTPLAGDRKYGRQDGKAASAGGRKYGRQDGEAASADGGYTGGLGLCAFGLQFVHPVTKEEMKFQIVPSQPVFQKFKMLQQCSFLDDYKV